VAGCDEVYRRGLYHEIRELVARNVQTTFEICRHEEEIDIISLSGGGGGDGGSTSRTQQVQQQETLMTRLTETVGLIKQDLTRTFPNNEFYRDEVNLGKLGNVIASYAGINREVGYCQGMNFLAGMLLQLSEDEEDTFWLLTLVMVRYNLQSLFTENIPLLHLLKFQYQLLFRDHLPRLEQHFTQLHVTSELYAVKWFFSLFAYSLPETTVFELWDFVFAACPPNQLHNGFMRAILIVALAIVSVLEKDLLNTDSIPDVLEVFEVNLKRIKATKILKVARQIDKLLLQANIENSRAIWAALPGNSRLNESIAKGELVALLMPAAILQFQKQPPSLQPLQSSSSSQQSAPPPQPPPQEESGPPATVVAAVVTQAMDGRRGTTTPPPRGGGGGRQGSQPWR
jgi:hypothetical protein